MKNKYIEIYPFIGKNYKSLSHKQLVIIGESHYLPDYSTAHLDAEKWYNGTSEHLDSTELSWFNTSNLIEWATESGFKEKGFSMYRQINSALKESGLKAETQVGGNDFYFNEIECSIWHFINNN
jgi:hypothetical protein